MSESSIAIIGNEGSGKTIFVGAFAHLLQNAPHGKTRLVAQNIGTARYASDIVDKLRKGEWPQSTEVDTLESLSWEWIEPSGETYTMRALDCAGQDFRQIFENGGRLTAHQQRLQGALHNAKIVVMLVNLNKAIEAHGLSERDRQDVEYAPAMALRKLTQSGVKTILLLSQSDLYRDHLNENRITSPGLALETYLPQLAAAAASAKSQVAFFSAISTKSDYQNGRSRIIPTDISRDNFSKIADIISGLLRLNAESERKNAEALAYQASLKELRDLPDTHFTTRVIDGGLFQNDDIEITSNCLETIYNVKITCCHKESILKNELKFLNPMQSFVWRDVKNFGFAPEVDVRIQYTLAP